MPRTFVWHPRRGPKSVPATPAPGSGKLRIRQIKSGIGHHWRQRLTLEALGLKHHQDEVILQDSPSLRGQIRAVRHLVEVTPVEE